MISRSLSAVAVLACLCPLATAQEKADSPASDAPIIQAIPDAEQHPPTPVKAFVAGQGGGELVATDLLDHTLYDASGSEIGTIVNVAIDENERLSLVVADVSDYVGTDKEVAFAFDALRYRTTDEEVRLVADVTREDLKKAPAFTSLADAAELEDMQGIAADDDVPQRVEPPAIGQ
jgi:hypothetical protein